MILLNYLQDGNVPVWVLIVSILATVFGKSIIPGFNVFIDRFLSFKTDSRNSYDKRIQDLELAYDNKIRSLEDRLLKAEEKSRITALKYARLQGMLELLRSELARQNIDVSVIDRYIETSHEIDDVSQDVDANKKS